MNASVVNCPDGCIRSIGRAIVNDEEFEIPERLIDDAEYRLGNIFLVVVRHHHHADGWRPRRSTMPGGVPVTSAG